MILNQFMTEKTIYLKSTDPVVLYGPNNQLLQMIQQFFPKVKIIARGDELKAIGPASEIRAFEATIERIMDHIERQNHLQAHELENLLADRMKQTEEPGAGQSDVLVYGQHGKAIRARTPHQKEMVALADKNDLMMAIGPAGSGKTYMAVALAVRALRNREVKKIILSRPAVESGEQLGFLPGDLREKLDPYLQPLYDALLDMMPARKLNELMDDNIIQIAPLAFMRGRTLENSYVILDEAQNATINQVKMFLTRMGDNAHFIVTGDVSQIDLPPRTPSGLVHARELLRDIPGIAIIHFDQQDIIRHRLVQKIVAAYEQEKKGAPDSDS